jgi:hypothetical protein
MAWARRESGRVRHKYTVDLNFKAFLAVIEGLLLPDKPSVPGTSRINTTPFPRSRYRANPHLRLRPRKLRPPPLRAIRPALWKPVV